MKKYFLSAVLVLLAGCAGASPVTKDGLPAQCLLESGVQQKLDKATQDVEEMAKWVNPPFAKEKKEQLKVNVQDIIRKILARDYLIVAKAEDCPKGLSIYRVSK
ncbi:MAG: hypothetical protein HYT94_02035 [Parcubacteria group bacterium]|nr:hypothetical protein [Parcubacteria group bacterium]